MDDRSNTMRAALTTLNRLFQEADAADLVISCGNKQWPLHSNIIATRSPFLKAKLAGTAGMKMKEIKIDNMDPRIMEQALKYMHGIPIELKAAGEESNYDAMRWTPRNSQDAYGLLEVSERLQMEDMKMEVGRIIGDHLSVQNALELGQLGEMFNNELLLGNCASFIAYGTSIKIGDDQAKKSPKLVAGVLRRMQQLRVTGLPKERMADRAMSHADRAMKRAEKRRRKRAVKRMKKRATPNGQ